MQTNNTVVLARYYENIEWVKLLQCPVVIYDKTPLDPVSTCITLENSIHGREAHTYFYHIVQNYDNLSNITIFAQADPFVHYPRFIKATTTKFVETTGLSTYDPTDKNHGTNQSFDLGWNNLNIKLGMRQCDYPIQTWFEAVLKQSPPPWVYYSHGAALAVPRHRITQRPRKFYEHCLEECLASDKVHAFADVPHVLSAWAFEVLWLYIFGDDRNPVQYGSKYHHKLF